MSIALKQDAIDRLWPSAAHSLTEGMVESSAASFAKYGVATFAECRDFLAQSSVECGAGTDIEENLNYTAQRLCQVWPSRFRTIGAAAPYAHNPRALADNVYGSRMGNLAGTDDGWKYRGRGSIDITGMDNYVAISKATGLDLIADPDLANDPHYFLECGLAFWRLNGLNVFAAQGNFREETLRINGGYTDLSTREAWRARWTQECFGDVAAPVVTPPSPAPTIVPAPDVTTILGLQTALRRLGFEIDVDGDYGPQTRETVKAFQVHSSLAADGIVGAQTQAALLKALAAVTH
jgi:putative chitinase